jgi:hypothetical protein
LFAATATRSPQNKAGFPSTQLEVDRGVTGTYPPPLLSSALLGLAHTLIRPERNRKPTEKLQLFEPFRSFRRKQTSIHKARVFIDDF